MTRIYLIRHAEAEGNLYRIAHGHEEGLITDYRGPRQIRALAQRFRDIPVDAVYASDLIRTQTTAQAIYMPKGLPLHPDPAFREIGMGVWEGLTWRQIETRWPLQLMEFNRPAGSLACGGLRDRPDGTGPLSSRPAPGSPGARRPDGGHILPRSRPAHRAGYPSGAFSGGYRPDAPRRQHRRVPY